MYAKENVLHYIHHMAQVIHNMAQNELPAQPVKYHIDSVAGDFSTVLHTPTQSV